MQFMPVAFSIMFLFFPAGLVLYWLVNNLLQIAQQWQMNRMLEREAPPRARSGGSHVAAAARAVRAR